MAYCYRSLELIMTLSFTLLIIIVTVGLSLLAFQNGDLKHRLMMNPYSVVHGKKWYKTLTHGFIHADYMHLFFNMYVLFGFGTSVEQHFSNPQIWTSNFPDIEGFGGNSGLLSFILLYMVGIVFATLPSIRKHRDNPNYYSLGASGAVSAVLIVYIIMFPQNKLSFIFLPGIPIPAFVMGALFFAFESYMNKKGNSGIAHDAHLYGALWGLIAIALLKPQLYVNFVSQLGNIF